MFPRTCGKKNENSHSNKDISQILPVQGRAQRIKPWICDHMATAQHCTPWRIGHQSRLLLLQPLHVSVDFNLTPGLCRCAPVSSLIKIYFLQLRENWIRDRQERSMDLTLSSVYTVPIMFFKMGTNPCFIFGLGAIDFFSLKAVSTFLRWSHAQ